MASGPERVQAALEALDLDVQVVRVPGSAKTAILAAEAVGCPVGAIVKSLVFVAGDDPVLVLCPGDRRVDTAKLAALRRVDPAAVGMAPAALVREVSGYAIGGVPPLGHVTALPTYMEQALLNWPVVYGAAGAPDALFPIDPNALQQITGAVVVQVT
jgi:prolyl-tRNA editing enzyme YbaK/EbsC (Cys-tRNA(Pro) deacylase)